MKKYNLSVIMTRAWEIKREHKDNVFSECLKMAWEQTKQSIRLSREMPITNKEREIKFPEISIENKEGTEKQKTYAGILVRNLVSICRSNGIYGLSYSTNEKFPRFTDRKTEEEMTGIYRFFCEAIKRKTAYGQIIDLLKYKSVSDWCQELRNTADKNNMSIAEYVDMVIAK